MIDIFDKNGTLKVSIDPDNKSSQQKQLMQQDIVSLTFQSSSSIDFQIGDHCTIFGQTYSLNQLPLIKKTSTKDFAYTLNLEGERYDLTNVQYLFLDVSNNFTNASFSIMGNAQKFADLLLLNLNRRYPNQWSLGQIISSDFKSLTFSNNNCLEVLGQITTAFTTEFFFEGKQINIYKRQENSGLSFQYGINKGLKGLQRSNKDSSNVVTHLNAFGGTQNIAAGYRGGSPNLLLPGSYFIEQNVAKYGYREASVSFPNIYPNRIGSVTSIGANEFTFSDTTLDFNLTNQLIVGTDAKIVFNTGHLAGYTFTLSNYIDTTKTITLNVNADEKAFTIPSPLIKAAVGDQYIITGIIMPQSYIDAAEQSLLTAATAYLALNSSPRIAYTAEVDPLYFGANNISLILGFNVHIIDSQIGLDAQIRINSFTRNLRDSRFYTFTLDETPSTSIVANLITNQNTINNVIAFNRLSDPNKARFNWKSEQELIKYIFDPEGNTYTSMIKPLFVETAGILIGTKSQQLNFDGVIFNPNSGGVASSFTNTAGIVYNTTILDSGIKSWNVAAGQYLNLEDGKPYYVYIKAEKTGSNSTVFLSQTSIVYDSQPDYYYFYVGFLGSPISGVRPFNPSYGFTAINGRFITTGRIQGNGGYIDLDNFEVNGKITFSTNSPAALQITTAEANAAQALLTSQTFQNSINSLNLSISNIASDNILSASEKQQVYLQYHAILNEYANILAQGQSYKVFLDYYNFAYGSITDYFNTYHLLDDLTTDSPIVGTDFRYRFSNYYTAKSSILKDISNAAKTLTANSLSAAQAAQSAADNAATAAVNSQLSANTANLQLSQIASDNYLSASEKQSVLLDVNNINSEYHIVIAQANNYGIDTSSYTADYNALINYINPFLVNINSGSVIDGPTFRDEFNVYYTARTLLLKAISDLAKTLANNAQLTANTAGTAAAGAQTTANNAALAAQTAQTTANNANLVLANIASDNILSASEKQTVYLQYISIINEHDNIVAQAASYAIKLDYYNFAFGAFTDYFNTYHLLDDLTIDSVINGTDFRYRFSNYYTARSGVLKAIQDTTQALASSASRSAAAALANAQNALNIANNVAQVTTFLSATTIIGNVVATGLLLVGDASSANALISGVTDQPNGMSVRFAAGFTSYSAKDTAPFRVLNNGTLYAANANISGIINAQSGMIGNYQIDVKGLINVANTDAYVRQIKTDANGNKLEASIGTGFDFNHFSVGTFINDVPIAGQSNTAIYARATNGTTPNGGSFPGNVAALLEGSLFVNTGGAYINGTLKTYSDLFFGNLPFDPNRNWNTQIANDYYIPLVSKYDGHIMTFQLPHIT